MGVTLIELYLIISPRSGTGLYQGSVFPHHSNTLLNSRSKLRRQEVEKVEEESRVQVGRVPRVLAVVGSRVVVPKRRRRRPRELVMMVVEMVAGHIRALPLYRR